MNRHYSESEKELILDIRKRTIGLCTVEGCSSGWIGEEACECRKAFVFLKEMVYARIPQEYWFNDLNNIDIKPKTVKMMVKKYIDKFKIAKAKGKGICFTGSNGIGKTTMLAEIGKAAIMNDFSVIYITAQDYINYKMLNDLDMLHRIEEMTQVILLDEIDKPYKKKGSDYVVSQMENFLRNSLPKNKILCFGSNWKLSEIKEEYGDSVYSIMNRKILFLSVIGDDVSLDLQEEWADSLDDNVDYLDDSILKISNKMVRFTKGE